VNSAAVEALLGSTAYFTQAAAPDYWHAAAIGQVGLYNEGAELNWYVDINHDAGDPVPCLIDNLCLEAGLRRAKFLVASAPVEDCTFEKLRRCGFCPFSWQQIWRFDQSGFLESGHFDAIWETPNPEDTFEIIRVQKKLMCPAVQAVTKNTDRNLPDFAYKENGIILGYSTSKSFGGKIVVTPLLSRESGNPLETLKSLILQYLDGFRKIYIRQTNDTTWLSPYLEAFAFPATPRLEMLVKHFAVQQKAVVMEASHSKNGRQTDTVTPFLQSGGKKS